MKNIVPLKEEGNKTLVIEKEKFRDQQVVDIRKNIQEFKQGG